MRILTLIVGTVALALAIYIIKGILRTKKFAINNAIGALSIVVAIFIALVFLQANPQAAPESQHRPEVSESTSSDEVKNVEPQAGKSEGLPTFQLIDTLPLNISQSSSNYSGNIELVLEKIDIFSDSRMKWYVSLLNKGSKRASTAFSQKKSYVVDELGTRYAIKKMSSEKFLDSGVGANVRKTGWLEFSLPPEPAMQFKLHLIRYTYGTEKLRMDPLEVVLPEPIPISPLSEPQSISLPPKGDTVGTRASESKIPSIQLVDSIPLDISRRSDNYEGRVHLILEKIEIFNNGRMKWYISFWNKGTKSASTAFSQSKSYAVDELGTRYEIKNMSTGGFLDNGVSAGVRRRGWLEFSIPPEPAMHFKLHLIRYTYGTEKLRMDPLEVMLPEPIPSESEHPEQ